MSNTVCNPNKMQCMILLQCVYENIFNKAKKIKVIIGRRICIGSRFFSNDCLHDDKILAKSISSV